MRLVSPAGTVVECDGDLAEKMKRMGWSDGESTASQKSSTPDKTWKNDDLKAYAAEHSIDLGDATKKEDYLAAIELHLEASGNQ